MFCDNRIRKVILYYFELAMNIKHKKNAIKGAYLSLFVFLFLVGCKKEQKTAEVIPIENRTPFVKLQEQYLKDISNCVHYLDSIATASSPMQMKQHYSSARNYFKKIEPILSFTDSENYTFLNQPNILKIEEDDYTDIKVKNPKGFQVLEEELYADIPDLNLVQSNAKLMATRLLLVKGSTKLDYMKSYHFLWIVKKAIIRVAVTGVTGFDSPVLENSLEESKTVYQSLKNYMHFFENIFLDTNQFQKWNNLLDHGIKSLTGDFVTFDRYQFIKDHTHPALQLLDITAKDWKVEFPFDRAIKNEAISLFGSDTFNLSYFSSEKFEALDSEKVVLGKKLFHDKKLSVDGTMSCASCHQSSLQYTDGKKIREGVTRNSPTLLYAALQKGFFYDKRAGSLEGQIVSVVNNENEFHTDLEAMEQAVISNTDYVKTFYKLYPKGVSQQHIRNAIAMFIRSLTPFDSKFDRNINNLENTLTDNEINGFNLFNGKAKCATCHFAPVFNGTIPPNFKESEMEFIGVPQKNDTINAKISKDLGRYYVYKTPERKHFFKTPTIRNSGMTGPYMHNGVYSSLEEVVDFYNRGGGSGIGAYDAYQTLPSDPLGLTDKEQQDLVAFMKTLNDPIIQENQDEVYSLVKKQ